jgi:methyl-accepting chemotaxis protein
MRGVIENADLIQGEASEISSAADDLSARTERQAATLEQTASALDELTSSVKSAAEGAAHANSLVDTARENAEASGDVVREAVDAMGEIEASSQQISKITGVIDEIAFQTNLLALNAGVEAARAGEAGRGFAVVASEVRALAQRSSDAAKEIAGLISSSSTHVKRGVGLVGQAGDALGGIEKSVADIHNFVAEIAVSARQQSSGLAEINIAVTKLDQVTQQNAAMFEQTTAASHSLTQEAETLSATVAQFHIDRAEIESGQGTVTAFQSSRKRGPTEMTTAASPTTGSARNSAEPRQWRPKRQAETHGATALADEADADLAGWEDF